MYIDRQEIVEELRLRKLIRKAIVIAESKRQKRQESEIFEEERLRKVIRNVIAEAEVGDTEDSPYDNTGLNTLNSLFDNILKTIETGYKELASSKEQRDSFASHMLKAVENTLAPLRALDKSDDQLDEDIDITVGEDKPEDMDDVRKSEDEVGKENFGIEGADETGRNIAYSSFKKIESNIIDAYELLSNEEDQELFYDYLIANAKLYFDKFESELDPNLEEPTNKAYEMAKDKEQDLEKPTPDELDLGL